MDECTDFVDDSHIDMESDIDKVSDADSAVSQQSLGLTRHDSPTLSFNPLQNKWETAQKRNSIANVQNRGSDAMSDASFNPLSNKWETTKKKPGSVDGGDDSDVDSLRSGRNEVESSLSFNPLQNSWEDMLGTPEENGRKNTGKMTNKSAKQSTENITVVRTRAPPKKPYEPAPFLSIDNRPVEHVEKKTGKKEYKKNARSVNSPKVPTNTPALSGFGTGSGITMSISSSEWNNMVPKKHKAVSKKAKVISANNHVRSPFKQDTNKSAEKRKVVMPDQKMKEATATATYQVAKAIATQPPETERKIPGRLLKARLKPLNTVNVNGPTIHHCRGIVSDARSYTPSPNRTLERRRKLLTNLNKDFLRDRPRTAESIHHTSVASDLTENREQDFREDDYLDVQEDSSKTEQNGIGTSSDEDNSRRVAEDPDKQEVDRSTYFTRTEVQQSGAENAGSQRPKSMQYNGLRKSVRFAEESAIDASKGRSRSAMPRLNSRDSQKSDEETNQERKQARESCRPEEFEVAGNHDDDMDDESKGPDQKNPEQRNHLRPSNGASAEPKNSFSGQKADGGQADTSEDTRQQSVRTSISEIQFSAHSEDTGPERPSSRGARPRSSLGLWEDVSKPDGDVKDLMVSGHGKDLNGRESEETPDCGGPSWTPGRPRSAHGLTLAQEQRLLHTNDTDTDLSVSLNSKPLNQRPTPPKPGVSQLEALHRKPRYRPVTAQLISGAQRNQDLSSEQLQQMSKAEAKPTRQRPQSAKVVNTHTATAPLRQRPQSARTAKQQYNIVSTKRSRQSGTKIARRPNSAQNRVPGGQNKVSGGQSSYQTKPINNCSYCGTVTARGIDFSAGNYFVVCEFCRLQTALRQETSTTDSQTQNIAESLVSDAPAESERSYKTTDETKEETEAFPSESVHRKEVKWEDDNEDDEGSATKHVSYPHPTLEGQGSQTSPQTQQTNKCLYCDDFTPHLVDSSEGSDFIVCEFCQLRTPLLQEVSTSEPQVKVIVDAQQDQSPEELITNLDDLEQSLDQVQLEIKACLQETAQRSVAERFEGPGSVQISTDMKITETGSELVNNILGELSEALIGNKDQNWSSMEQTVKVYQFVEKNGDQTVAPSPGNQSPDAGNMAQESANGNISTYDVTLMSPLQSGVPKNVRDSSLTQGSPGSFPLEMQAQQKPLNKSKCGGTQAMPQPAAPCAPLCFQVNARPPPGYMYYFAYGMDMNPDRMSTSVKRVLKDRFWGLLFGFHLLFNKKGVDEEAGAFPNIELREGSSVEGCLYLITQAELNLLDRTTGYPEHFEHVVLPIWLLNCPDVAELGVAQYCVPAVMYIARDRWIHTGDTPLDCTYSVEQSLKGSNILSPAYVSQLQSYRT